MNRRVNFLLVIVLGLFISACTTKPDVGTGSVEIAEDVVEGGSQKVFGTDYTLAELIGSTNYSLEDLARILGGDPNPLNHNTLYFEYNSSALDERSNIIAHAHALNVRARGGARITLAGHADERGTRDYNLALGERRSQQVADFMRNVGVGGSSIATPSYGEEEPADPAHTEAAWAKNRRVVMSFAY